MKEWKTNEVEEDKFSSSGEDESPPPAPMILISRPPSTLNQTLPEIPEPIEEDHSGKTRGSLLSMADKKI